MRLSRAGKKKKPYYHVVIVESHKKRDGKNIEVIGFYDPLKEENQCNIDAEKAIFWYKRGAQPSDTVKSLIKKQGIELTTK